MKSYHIDRFGTFDGLVQRDHEMPQPGHHEVLVRVAASSLNYRDIAIIRSFYGGRSFRPGLVPVSDGAGEIVALGDGVKDLAIGDRVAGVFRQNWQGGRKLPARAAETDLGGGLDGMLTEYAVLREEGVVRVPEHLSFAEAATLPCAALTAWHALEACEPLQSGETVLVLGSGGVSIFALEFATRRGARVIATSSSDDKLARMRALGADATVNYATQPEWDAEVLKLSGGRGVDRVIEVGGSGTLARSMRCCAHDGRVIVIGVLSGPGQIDPAIILLRRLTLQAITTGSRDMFESMNRALAREALHPVIDSEFAFDDARQAYEYLESGRHFGKIVIRHS